MSKIIVPQELQQQIVSLYNEGKTRKDIKLILQVPFGDSVIKRILVEHGCEIRSNPGAQKGGRKKDEINLDDQNKILKLYREGYGLNYISKQMNGLFCADKVKRVLLNNGVTLRNFHEALSVKPDDEVDLRIHRINDNYNFENHNGAWILGFLAVDGYLPNTRGAKNRIVLSLARKDEEVLYKIKEELGYTGPIYQYNSTEGQFPCSSLTFNSKTLRQAIESYGIVNNKTFKLNQLPQTLPKEYMIDYIRGFFDGDGSIVKDKNNKVTMRFTCATKEMLQSIVAFLHEEYNLPLPSITRDHNNYQIIYYKNSSRMLGDLFYNHPYLSLARKQQHYFEIFNNTQEKIAPTRLSTPQGRKDMPN